MWCEGDVCGVREVHLVKEGYLWCEGVVCGMREVSVV